MAAGYDGSIRIDTRIDTKGFNTGTKQISSGLTGIASSLKGVAAAAGLAFGVKAIVDFGKASIKAATDLTNAMMGLQSIMEGQGRSFAKAQQFINDYVSDGLIPATKAITAYKNLALRGYDDSQIQQVLIALKDSAAFGRQASYTMGEAVEMATEGLKNENSILVDNAGVTKNVAKMWEDYAKSIGVATNDLTKQQKIQAEVLGIMEETKFQTGDAAKIAESYSGQVLRLGFNFNNLKIAVGNALIPLAQAVLPSINAIIEGLTRLANIFAQVSTAIFGKQADTQKQIATSGTAAQKSQTGLAKATKAVGDASKKTNKELKNSLANFDELNVLAKNTADGMGDVVSGTDFGIDTVGSQDEVNVDISINPKIQEFINGLKTDLAELSPYIENLNGALGRFKEVLGKVWEKLEPVRKLIGEFIKNKALDIIAGVVMEFAGALDVLSGLLLLVCGILTGDWGMALEGAKLMLQGVGEMLEAVFIVILGRDAVESIKTFISEWKTRISTWWTQDVKPWFTKERWLQLWTDVKTWWGNGWAGISTWWNTTLPNWWKTSVTPWFTKQKWLSIMAGVKDGFAETFKNAVNTAIALFNKFIGWVNSKMRFSWDGIKIAGKQIVPAGNVQLFTIPNIPKLATGAVIPPNGEFLAVLGDQRSGRNLEAPEDLIRQIVREENGSSEIVSVLKDLLAATREGKVIAVDNQVLGKVVNKSQSTSFKTSGKTLIPV
ncbi:hypothetical protein [Dehalobacter restrictus]|uniref:hypothetical protein n=1 Tax=Dehalobacter restrictus TaxID=55583 RepID=UPI00338ED833